MSKCEFTIQFDRADRVYHGGETVTGRVTIRPNKDLKSNGILIEYYWQTHGRGNRTRGKLFKTRIDSAPELRAGESVEVPFEFQSGRWPLTHHGDYINVDHYVKVSIDVPFAFDPKHSEEFIVLPGELPEGLPTHRGEATKLTGKATGGSIPWFILVILALTFAIPIILLTTFLLPFLAIAAIIVFFVRRLYRSRVGDVELTIPHVVVAPQETLTCELSFTPKRTFSVNEIIVTLEGVERATSGSGTDATTYTNSIFKDVAQLHPPGQLVAGQPFRETVTLTLPETTAYTLQESDNKIAWNILARIDIPRCPDWKKRTELQLLPQEFVGQLDGVGAVANTARPVIAHPVETAQTHLTEPAPTASPSRKEPDSVSHSQRPTSPPPTSSQPPVEAIPVEPLDVNPAESVAAAGHSLIQLVRLMQSKRRYGSERSDLVEAAQDHIYTFRIVIERIADTFDLSDRPPEYAEGRTVTGKLEGIDQEVQLFAHVDSTSSLQMLSAGDAWQVDAVIESFDSLYNRLVMREQR